MNYGGQLLIGIVASLVIMAAAWLLVHWLDRA